MTTPRAQIAMFFFVATAIYGGLHAYLWWKATRQLGLRAPAISRTISPAARLPALGGPRLFQGIAAATTLIVGWAAFEASNVRVRRILVPTAKLAPYVSRGTGTWGPPLRFLAPPEVTLFELSAPP